MLLVKTKLKESPIQGIGLFADEFIPKGTLIWKFTPKIDTAYTLQEVENLKKEGTWKAISKYAYHSKITNKYVLCGDDARFINHSSINPATDDTNTWDEIEGLTIAARDIQKGEEITSDYSVFYENYEEFQLALRDFKKQN